MKKLSFILRFLLLATIASSQTYTATIAPGGQLAITDAAQPQPMPGFDALMVEWTALGGGCTIWESGKLTPASSYTLTLPAQFTAGLMLQKTVWRGKLQPNGPMKWQGQSISCTALVLPPAATCASDTVYLNPISVHISGSAYTPDWLMPVVEANSVDFTATPDQPDGVKLTARWLYSQAGYLVVNYDNLAPGLYFAVTAHEWQGMTFVETDEFIVN